MRGKRDGERERERETEKKERNVYRESARAWVGGVLDSLPTIRQLPVNEIRVLVDSESTLCIS